ncbi:MAG: hypothetical protein C6P37_08280 [Caldibacillus debilis]|uniref:Lipoprotein n=1 Tax=Caldibacillus debilis TaxID=301148 RepID=A0A3E0K4K0_9BACI|nr:hypothetical protein [Caldibacillus debilis]MBY6272234.1 hypothetical protein [Bacillaceae bacterium]OUM89854.1 MAG: hypothetical protein BAA03_11645 [Caldibacillus debilis]REJ28627.1 MAG: hypothetical protein C6P37_08280 [Caldibacillus debilis]REJ29881.1 MAG: hypothetical protein C6W56_04565 [Caldibacillus debilis]
MKNNPFFYLLCIFLMIWIVGCSNGVVTKGRKNEHEIFTPSVKAFIEANGTKYEMKRGRYQWEKPVSPKIIEAVLVEYATPYEMAGKMSAIPLKPGEEIIIIIERNPQIAVCLWNEGGMEREVEVRDGNRLTLPSNPGKYIYEVAATWPNGEASYTFVAELE